jgi:hypothetical protein
MVGVNCTRPNVDDLLNKVLSNALLSKCKKKGSVSVPMEFFSNFLKKKGATKDLEVAEPSSNIDTMVDKEEAATTPNKKNAKPPKATYNSLGASKVSSSGETMANKEEATTPNKKHAKPLRGSCNAFIVVKRIITTCNQEHEPIKKGVGTRFSSRS